MTITVNNKDPFDCGLGGFGSYGYFLPPKREDFTKCLLASAFNVASYIPVVGLATGFIRGRSGYGEFKNLTADGKGFKDRTEAGIQSSPQASRAFAIGAMVRAVFEALGLGVLFLPVDLVVTVIRWNRWMKPEKTAGFGEVINLLNSIPAPPPS